MPATLAKGKTRQCHTTAYPSGAHAPKVLIQGRENGHSPGDSLAREFYEVLAQARDVVHEQEVSFNYNPSQSSIQSLADAVLKSTVMSLVLRMNFEVNVPQRRRYDPLVTLLAEGDSNVLIFTCLTTSLIKSASLPAFLRSQHSVVSRFTAG